MEFGYSNRHKKMFNGTKGSLHKNVILSSSGREGGQIQKAPVTVEFRNCLHCPAVTSRQTDGHTQGPPVPDFQQIS